MADKDVVLVVEDEALVRDSIVLELEDAGFDVIAAENGDEASFILPRMRRIDLLVTDIRMPGRINGWVLADMARCRRPNLPVIYTSAFASQEASKVEGSLFLAKPYRIAEILNAFGELKSSSKRLFSINRKLLSANEDLEISNEELQSLNERLQKENTKLKVAFNELSRASSDKANGPEGGQIATIVLDRTLRIKRFTPAAKDLFYLVQSDVGRPISRIRSRLRLDCVHEVAHRVLRTLSPIEVEIESDDGAKIYMMRILPNSTPENVIAGVVINFIDVTGLRPPKPRYLI